MKNITLEDIAKVTGGELNIGKGDVSKEATCVVVDSRQIKENGIFVATKGERVDGHSFIPQVMEKGALGVICETAPENKDYPYILVKDSFKALKDLAEYYRQQLDIKIVGIVGSVGKTSTKEIVAATLETHYRVLKTQGNFNNEVGVPLTLFRIEKEHEVAVVEMGISDFGEMSRLGRMVKPDMVVMTNIGPCHLENLIDLDGVLKAKTEVFDYMPCEGTIFLSAFDEKLCSIKESGNRKIIYYGGDDVFASDIESHGLKGSDFVLNLYGSKMSTTIHLPGMHMIQNALAAAAVGYELGLSIDEISLGIGNAKATEGRSNLIETDRYLLVDDCYNANPKSMRAAIDLMKYAEGRKVTILGDMFELGENELSLHGSIGRCAVEKNIDLLICVGKLSKAMYESALEAKEKAEGLCEILYYETRDELLKDIADGEKTPLKEKDTILVKASHGMGFAEVVKALL